MTASCEWWSDLVEALGGKVALVSSAYLRVIGKH
jgi:hypothetical protein